jgi:NAD(P)-dependent dehydrogenase (short-subunit alcohol dehydrogenase family)
MSLPKLGLLPFQFNNPTTFSFEPQGPIPFLWQNVLASVPPLDQSQQSLTNKTVLITGANRGCGLEASKLAAKLGAKVIMTARSSARGEVARKMILEEVPDATIELLHLDMASFVSVRLFAERLRHEVKKLDIAILNAGACEFGWSVAPETGYEMTTQVNISFLVI